MGNGSRLDRVREDLKVQITDVYPSPGTIIIVHPKNAVQFNPEFSTWLADTLQTLLPAGVQGMVLSENVTKFNVIGPESDNQEYVRGFHDAIRAIAELNT